MADDLNKQSEQFNENLGKASDSARGIVDALKQFGDTNMFKNLAGSVERFNKELEASEGYIDKIKDGSIDLASAQAKQAQVKKLHNNLSQKADKLESQIMGKMKGKSAAEKKAIRDKIQGLKSSGKLANQEMKNAINLAAKGETSSVKFLDKFASSTKDMGWTKSAKAAGTVSKGMRGAAIAGKGLLKTLGVLVKLASRLMGSWLSIILLVYDFVKFIINVNSEVVSISKNLGISRDRAREFRDSLFEAAYASNNTLNTQQELLKVHGQINQAMGTSMMLNLKLVDDVATLQNRMNLTAEAAMGLAKNTMVTGKTVAELTSEIGEGAVAMEKQLGINIDVFAVMEKVAKTTGQMRALYQGNEGALARVLTRAQALGLTMAQIAKSSGSMLNFHSSIEKELSAELFLGKSLNLEQARLAALTGDQETFLNEITKNAGDYLDFTRMNVLQQRALADALGMGVDELADMLFEQTKLEDLKDKATEREYAEIEQAKTQLDLQQKFNAAIDRAKMIFTDLLDGIEEWVMPNWMAWALGIEGGQVFNTRGDENMYGDTMDKVDKGLAGTGLSAPAMQLNDFKITTHPEDTFLMAGGTGAWQGNMQQQQQQPIIVQADINYDSYAAVKASTHHDIKWNN